MYADSSNTTIKQLLGETSNESLSRCIGQSILVERDADKLTWSLCGPVMEKLRPGERAPVINPTPDLTYTNINLAIRMPSNAEVSLSCGLKSRR